MHLQVPYHERPSQKETNWWWCHWWDSRSGLWWL